MRLCLLEKVDKYETLLKEKNDKIAHIEEQLNSGRLTKQETLNKSTQISDPKQLQETYINDKLERFSTNIMNSV